MRSARDGCFSCRLCDLACPAWQESRDPLCGPRAITLMAERGQEIAPSQLAFCTLCGACDAACPQKLQPMTTILELGQTDALLAPFPHRPVQGGRRLLVGGRGLLRHFPGYAQAPDDGDDIIEALRGGMAVDRQRVQQFLYPLAAASSLIAADGLRCYLLRHWLPEATIHSLAGMLLPSRQQRLQPGDLLLLDAPGFHADCAQVLPLLRFVCETRGVVPSLDLQRLAQPLRSYRDVRDAGVRARWQALVRGRSFTRVVVENPQEVDLAALVSGLPTVWLGVL